MYILKDYLNFRGDLSFNDVPVNEIDEMVFSSMGKADFSGVLHDDEFGSYRDVFKTYFEQQDCNEEKKLGLLESPVLLKVLNHIASCPRYADVKIGHFINKISTAETEQISALTVLGPGGKVYVTFRGTDDTLVGWKENCELAVLESVPAQRDALEYLENAAASFPGPIVLSGHSKGGNLAVYAAANACPETQSRIEQVVSYDGPGFLGDFFEKPGYKAVEDRIVTLVPTASMVGMFMEHAGSLRVVECERTGPGAHDIFAWNVNRNGFVHAPEVSDKSMIFHEAFNDTISGMAPEERQEIVDEIFEVLSSTGAENLMDFSEHRISQAWKIAGRFNKSKEIKQFLLLFSRFSIKGRVSNTIGDLQEKIQDKVIEPVKDKIDVIEVLRDKK